MRVLADVLARQLGVVFAEAAVGECAADRGHYYAGTNNAFWRLLYESGLTPRRLGAVDWRIGATEVFVLPSSSGANRRRDYDGRATRLEWWQELADYVR